MTNIHWNEFTVQYEHSFLLIWVWIISLEYYYILVREQMENKKWSDLLLYPIRKWGWGVRWKWLDQSQLSFFLPRCQISHLTLTSFIPVLQTCSRIRYIQTYIYTLTLHINKQWLKILLFGNTNKIYRFMLTQCYV